MHGLVEDFELELPAHSGSVAAARHAAAALAARHGADEADVKIAISEAVGNAVLHAYRGDQAGQIRLQGSIRRGKLVFIVSDDGAGMAPNPHSTGLGLGLPLIGRVAEDMRVDAGPEGTSVSMSFPIGLS